MSDMPIIKLRAHRETPIRAGHPWVFSNALIGDIQAQPGVLVRVMAADNSFLGIGTYNPLTSIRIRIISTADEQINETFFVNKLVLLDKMKQKYLPSQTNGYRLVHSDADGFPGLIIDRYDQTFVFQIHTAGMEHLRPLIISSIKKAFRPAAIVERSDVSARKEEGLQDYPVQVHLGQIDSPVDFLENGYSFLADVLSGQKTGFFLDQRDARLQFGMICSKRKVLNLFCYSGAFSVYAALAGAESVVSVDTSEAALELAIANFKLNKLDPASKKYEFIKADVFDYLHSLNKSADFDFIVCDPPAFAKSKAKVEQAIKAYEDLNKKCFELLKTSCLLASSSCSGRVTLDDFKNMLRMASGKAGRDTRVIACMGQAFDHTEKLSFPEGRYLKTIFVEVL
ncbi:MAG: class I SAM-dependent rRNA methyltransferase [Candidatus Margulisbacteria bacterium]|nr:class I SAM-dependent rRNA methyltransferase [Candidatus Margulisiibacteriota bacterium]